MIRRRRKQQRFDNLFDAIAVRDLGELRRLVAAGADPDRGEGAHEGWTPLIYCLNQDWTEGLAALIKAGANVRKADATGFTILHWACVGPMPEPARLLLDAGADPNAVPEMREEAPLHYICRGRPDCPRQAEMIRLLAAHGADLDLEHRCSGDTALHMAAGRHAGDAVLALLELGARTDLAGSGGLLPGEGTRSPLIRHLLRPRPGVPEDAILFDAIELRQVTCLGRVLDQGANADAGGGRALELAVRSRNAASVSLLLDAGADPMAASGAALDAALAEGEPALLEPFVAAGAERDFLDGRMAALKAKGVSPALKADWFHDFVTQRGEGRPRAFCRRRARVMDGVRQLRGALFRP
jgi:ankyrin repeat protein